MILISREEALACCRNKGALSDFGSCLYLALGNVSGI